MHYVTVKNKIFYFLEVLMDKSLFGICGNQQQNLVIIKVWLIKFYY